MMYLIKNLSPSRIIALGFALLILLGHVLLILSYSVQEGVQLSGFCVM